jgi:hypothetical protein
MLPTDDSPHTLPLPDELDRALRRATDRTLAALTALRRAVREHVHSERASGNDLDEIQLALRGIIARAQDGLPRADGNGDGQHDALTTQMIKWSEGFYTERQ